MDVVGDYAQLPGISIYTGCFWLLAPCKYLKTHSGLSYYLMNLPRVRDLTAH